MDPVWLIWEKTLKFVPGFLRLCPIYLFPFWSCIVSFHCNKPWPWVQQDFPSGSLVKNPPANAGDTGDVGLILGQENLLEKEMATPSSILAWRLPWIEEPGGLQSTGVAKSWTQLSDFTFLWLKEPGIGSLSKWSMPSAVGGGPRRITYGQACLVINIYHTLNHMTGSNY